MAITKISSICVYTIKRGVDSTTRKISFRSTLYNSIFYIYNYCPCFLYEDIRTRLCAGHTLSHCPSLPSPGPMDNPNNTIIKKSVSEIVLSLLTGHEKSIEL